MQQWSCMTLLHDQILAQSAAQVVTDLVVVGQISIETE